MRMMAAFSLPLRLILCSLCLHGRKRWLTSTHFVCRIHIYNIFNGNNGLGAYENDVVTSWNYNETKKKRKRAEENKFYVIIMTDNPDLSPSYFKNITMIKWWWRRSWVVVLSLMFCVVRLTFHAFVTLFCARFTPPWSLTHTSFLRCYWASSGNYSLDPTGSFAIFPFSSLQDTMSEWWRWLNFIMNMATFEGRAEV